MDLKQQVQLKMKDFEECWTVVNSDCPIGRIYDFSCVLQAFCIERMKQVQEAQKKPEEKPVEPQA